MRSLRGHTPPAPLIVVRSATKAVADVESVGGGVVADGAVVQWLTAVPLMVLAVAGGTYTVMRTVRETVYDQVQETRYRTRNETYYEDQQVQATRMVPETTTREVQYTVMVPTYETKTRTINYTVNKPVYETHCTYDQLHGP